MLRSKCGEAIASSAFRVPQTVAAGSNPVISTKRGTPTSVGVPLFVYITGLCLRPRVPNEVRDEVASPSTAGGGCSEGAAGAAVEMRRSDSKQNAFRAPQTVAAGSNPVISTKKQGVGTRLLLVFYLYHGFLPIYSVIVTPENMLVPSTITNSSDTSQEVCPPPKPSYIGPPCPSGR